MKIRFGYLVITCAAVLLDANTALGEPSFQGLGIPMVAMNSNSSSASAASSDGSIVVGSISGSNPVTTLDFTVVEAFRWNQDTGMTTLGHLDPAFRSTSASSVSGDGTVIVGSSDVVDPTTPSPVHFQPEAFYWTQETGIVGLGRLNSGDIRSQALGTSSDGSLIVGFSGGSSSFDPQEAFYWTQASGMVGLGHLKQTDTDSQAWNVSADGSVIVGHSGGEDEVNGGFPREAFYWTQETGMVGLGHLRTEDTQSFARDTSSDGSVIVGESRRIGATIATSSREAFRWTKETGMQGLGFLRPQDNESFAFDTTADGSVVVGVSKYFSSNFSVDARKSYIWDADHGMRNLQQVLETEFGLDLTGWYLNGVSGISDDGTTIFGSGINPDGNFEAWVAVIPEPGSFFVFGGLFASWVARRRR